MHSMYICLNNFNNTDLKLIFYVIPSSWFLLFSCSRFYCCDNGNENRPTHLEIHHLVVSRNLKLREGESELLIKIMFLVWSRNVFGNMAHASLVFVYNQSQPLVLSADLTKEAPEWCGVLMSIDKYSKFAWRIRINCQGRLNHGR